MGTIRTRPLVTTGADGLPMLQAMPNTRNGEQPGGITMALTQADVEARANILANEIIRNLTAQNNAVQSSGRVFTRFEPTQDIIENQKTFVTTGLFSNNEPTMSYVYTSSLQTATQKNYYYEVWNDTSVTAEAQFSVAYGNRKGSGSYSQGTLNDSPTRAIYSQHRLLLLDPSDTTFTFGNGQSSDSIYTLNWNRARVKDKVDPGNWQLVLTNMSSSLTLNNNSYTGSSVKSLGTKFIQLIDDSEDNQEILQGGGAKVYNIVSGTLTGGIYNSAAPHYYGLFYPDMGIAVFNGDTLNLSMSFNTVSGSGVAGDNAWKLYTSISGAMAADKINNTFQARNEETVTSTHFFVRVKNGEYNFSNNPTFVTGSEGTFSQPTFLNDPTVYITTVGMYNDRQELLAVGKLSQPIQKSFSKESLIKVRLDF